jgi:hypothetical protein
MAGGSPGRCGRNALLRADGRIEELGGSAQVAMAPGDAFLLETPGGGGWGAAPAIDGAPQQPGTAHPPAPSEAHHQGSRGPAAGAARAAAAEADPWPKGEDCTAAPATANPLNGDPAGVARPIPVADRSVLAAPDDPSASPGMA